MSKINHFMRSVTVFLLTLTMIISNTSIGLTVPASAQSEPFSYPNEDSTFFLKSSNVGIDEDYFPESADIEQQREYEDSYRVAEDVPTVYASSNYPGDAMVYLTQRWLNQEYGSVSGFGTVTENGKTGWNVVYGLTRALQVELGITDLANNFGPTTSRLYGQNLLHRQDGVTNRMFAILQGALWCKGYNPGYYLRELSDGTVVFDEIFDAQVERAVIEMKTDAGLLNPDGTVTVNVMKALLSMDSFKMLSTYYGAKPQVRLMQQKINREYEAYTGLIPCDGVYGRNTNKALIYAIQAVEGLPIGTATGNFGPTTKNLLPQLPYTAGDGAAKDYQGNYYTSAKIQTFTEFMQFALFINGFGDGVFNGQLNKTTKQAIHNFQVHYALPKTGIVDITTWMSLLISSGDPNRTAIAADCATILNTAKAQTLYNNGYRYIGRYLTGTYGGGISKALTVEEANIILNAGLRFFPIYQTSSNSEGYFTEQRGTYDAEQAINAAINLGIPADTIIYFAVDFDAMDYQITDSVIPYFSKVYETVLSSGYKVGVYGARNVCSRVAAAGYSVSSFVGDMSTGFSGNLGFKIPDNWAFSQFANLEGSNALGSGDGRIEIDKDAFSGRDQGVGKLNSVTKKAIYVLPGYMGSKLFMPDNTQFWLEGTGMNPSLLNSKNITIVEDIIRNAKKRKSSIVMLREDGSNSPLHVDASRDEYGAVDMYKDLVDTLRDEFADQYDIVFSPYNWLGDLNDSVNKLRQDITAKGYSNVVFVTHSTGGLLASAFIADNNRRINKVKIDKAILIAAPLFGTYTALSPLENGTEAFLKENFKLVNGFADLVKYSRTQPVGSPFPTSLLQSLSPIVGVYDVANNWIKDVTHNSPTTYQLLPSAEYIKLMPQLYEDEFRSGKAVTSMDEYYRILNGSSNINSNLTNGNSRSHKYFRDTVLNGDIVSVLQTVDTVLIASKNCNKKTPTIAKYSYKLFGGTKLSEIVYQEANYKNEYTVGDGTVQYNSATANDGSGEQIRVISEERIGHTELVSSAKVLREICAEIHNIEFDESVEYEIYQASDSLSITDMLKINFTCDKLMEISIYGCDNTKVADVSEEDYFGFDGKSFIFYSYPNEINATDATIYMPNSGYKIVFKYGSYANHSVDFDMEVSTLNEDGWKEQSVTYNVDQTGVDGIIAIIDGTQTEIDSTNIDSVVGGYLSTHFTDWELSEELELEYEHTQPIIVSGNHASQVSSLLKWSSSDENVITVTDGGFITATGYGQAIVTATDGNKIASCSVTVPQNAISINIDDVSICVGDRYPLAPTFYPATATGTDVIYTYGNSNVISIDEFGVIHALASGNVTVTSTTEYGVTDTFVVNVVDQDFSATLGDVNQDGDIDIRDLVRLKKHIAEIVNLTGKECEAADLNRDGVINAVDLSLLRKLLLGVI